MNVDAKQVQAILDTLPIGYYLGSGASVTLDETGGTSRVNPMTKEIKVSFRNVADALAAMPDEIGTEGAIRDELYHETAHLLLTPREGLPHSIVNNILEDERIEVLLRDYFHGVNFRRSVFALNQGWKPDCFENYLFGIARMRKGPENLIRELDAMIHAMRAVTAGTDGYNLSYAYYQFAKKVREAWNQAPENPENAPKAPEGNGSGEQENQNGSGSAGSGTGEKSESANNAEGANLAQAPETPEAGNGAEAEAKAEKPEKSAGNGAEAGNAEAGENEKEPSESVDGSAANAEGNAEAGKNGKSGETEETEPFQGEAKAHTPEAEADAAERRVGVPKITESGLENAKRSFGRYINSMTNESVAREVERIIVRATKKRANKSGASYGYAGKIDPKAVAMRQDYRWLAKSGDDGNKFDRIHLRLWVDCSGSFCYAVKGVNELISSLLAAEKRLSKFFALSVIVMGDDNRVHDKTQRIYANENNNFGPNVVECAKQTERKGWKTINVAVWDGQLGYFPHCGGAAAVMNIYGKSYAALDGKDTIIVSDDCRANKALLNRGCPQARKVFISDDYAETFVGEVLKQLDRVL